MLCECCHESQATVHLTQVVGGAVKKLHLCADCAEAQGIDLEGPISITDLLCEFGKEMAPPPAPENRRGVSHCPVCGMGRADFKKTGRLGCPRCYEHFADEVGELLKAMHHAGEHKGKSPSHHVPVEPQAPQEADEMEVLSGLLKKAIDEEQYEEAARLRDRMQALSTARGEEFF